MTNALSKMLAEKEFLLADGATGTNLFNMGLQSGDAPELWNTDEPAKITALYKGAVDAGSDLFLTNTFGGNASRLKLHGAEKRVRELNRIGAELGRDLADKTERKVVVAGSVGPTGEIMEPVGSLSHALAVEMFHEQAEGLKEGGVDVLWVETISAAEEFNAAAEAFGLAGMPWCGTMSFDTAGRTMMGVHLGRSGTAGRKPAQPADRFWRELRHRRLGYPQNRAGFHRPGHRAADHLQGQRRHPEIRARPYPLRRHAGTDGRLRGDGP